MPAFLPGREPSRRFYEEAVRPLLDERFPGLPHAAAHLGRGSDVLGFDTEMSTDHAWGPSVLIFLRDQDAHLGESMREVLSYHLPHTFYGYPVNFDESPLEPGTVAMNMIEDGPVNHRVFPMTLRTFFLTHLAYYIAHPPHVAEWFTFPSQPLREIAAGAVHHDGIGELTKLRADLAWYPHHAWLSLLASAGQPLGRGKHRCPRAAFVGDGLGSALIASRVLHDVSSLRRF